MESVFLNGGMIGVTLDYGDTERYLLSGSIDPATITLVANTGRVTQTGASFTLPAGLQPGDLVIVASASDDNTPNYPTGYTQGQRGRDNVGYQWSYKFMGDPVDTTVSGLTNDARTPHLAIAFRGVNPTTPLDVSSPGVTDGGSGTPNPPAITTTTNNAVVVALGFLDDDNVASTAGAPTNFTFAAASQGSSGGATVMAAFRTKTPAGSEDPGAFSGGSDDWIAATLALRPGTIDNRVFGNQKNSGIWLLQSVYDELAGTYSNPEASLGTATRTLSQSGSYTPSASFANSAVIAIDMAAISSSDYGVVFEVGGATGYGLAIGIDNATSQVRVGAYDSSGTWKQSGQAWIEADFSSYYGQTGTFYIVGNWTNKDVKLYWLSGGPSSGNQATLLGTGTGGGSTAIWGTGGAGVGFMNTAMVNLGFTNYNANYTGTINQVRMWENTSGPDPFQTLV
jgi:hypothetical protein